MRKLAGVIVVLAALLMLVMLWPATAAEPELALVMVGFEDKVDPSVITGVGGKDLTEFSYVPYVRATVPESAIEKLRHEPGVTSVHTLPEICPEQGKITVIVAFQDKVDPKPINEVGGMILHQFNNIEFAVAEVLSDQISQLRAKQGVMWVEESGYVYAQQVTPWNIRRVDARLVHQRMDPNLVADVKVAVIDNGIWPYHEDLDVAGGVSFVPHQPWWNDNTGHGTRVAGVLAAVDNLVGVVGVSPMVDLYAVKVLHNDVGPIDALISAIDWCIDNDMDVVNMSLGTHSPSLALDLICYQAHWHHDVFLVAAAGNSGPVPYPGSNIMYPAFYWSVIAVGATDQNNDVCDFSSTGPRLDLVAPGIEILTTCPWDGYAYGAGTSFSAPHVSGVAALIRAVDPTMCAQMVRYWLRDNAVYLGEDYHLYGRGLVSAWRAVPRLVVSLQRSLVNGVEVIDVSVRDNYLNIGLEAQAGAHVVLSVYWSNGTIDEYEAWTDQNGNCTILFPSGSIYKVLVEASKANFLNGRAGLIYNGGIVIPDPGIDPR